MLTCLLASTVMGGLPERPNLISLDVIIRSRSWRVTARYNQARRSGTKMDRACSSAEARPLPLPPRASQHATETRSARSDRLGQRHRTAHQVGRSTPRARARDSASQAVSIDAIQGNLICEFGTTAEWMSDCTDGA